MKIKKEELFNLVETVAKSNFMDVDELFKLLEEAIIRSFHSKLDPDAKLEFKINKKTKTIKLINKSKLIVDGEVEIALRPIEISLKDAKKINSKAKVNETIADEVDFSEYSKYAATSIKQLLLQNVREKKKKEIYEKYKNLKGTVIPVTVTSVSNNHAIFALEDGTTAFMPETLMNKKIKLNIGEKIKIFVENVLEDSRDSQIIVSNGSPQMVKRALEIEIPEIQNGTIKIMAIARIAGERSKVALSSSNPDIDPIGTVIGPGGQRIKAIIERLDGEKIDVIRYSEDINEFIAAAMSPARVISINDKNKEETNKLSNQKIVVTPNRHQTLAIGKGGQNIKLVAELVKHKIDVFSYSQSLEENIDILWNGNVKPEELESIENSTENKFYQIRQNNKANQMRRPKYDSWNNLQQDDGFEEEIMSFTEEITLNQNMKDDETINMDEMFNNSQKKKYQEISEEDFDLDSLDIDDDFK